MNTGLSYSESQGIIISAYEMEYKPERNPTHFIEQVHYENDEIISLSVIPIKSLDWALSVSSRAVTYHTIALFKIYPKTKLP